MDIQTAFPYNTVVAIDPDVDRNGVACLDVRTQKLDIRALSFPETLQFLHDIMPESKTIVIIEAGWLNHAHWHIGRYDSKANAAAKGNAVGRNHEVGRKIAEMCKYWNMPFRLVKPLKKIWQGKDGKITATELTSITGYKGRTNQEGRDAALLSWVTANFPIRINRI